MAIGSEIIGQALKRQGADMFFYIMGGPMMHTELATMGQGIRGIDVRHEQAAAMMAFAYARLRNRPGICMAASGPATTNLVTGVAHAWADCSNWYKRKTCRCHKIIVAQKGFWLFRFNNLQATHLS